MVRLLRSQWLRYAVSVLTVFTAWLLTQLFSTWAIVAPISLLACLIAVLLSAWYGGVGAGLLATGTSALVYSYYFLNPVESLASSGDNAVALGLFGVSGTLTSLLCGKLQDTSQNLEGRERSAKQQSELYQQAQQFNTNLELEVQRRTAQLQLASDFEAALKRITDKVRDSLDEAQILQAAVQELGVGMGVNSCNAGLYDLDAGTSTIAYEYNPSILSFKGHVTEMSEYSALYAQLLAGQYCQFCPLHISPMRGRVAILACPIEDHQEVLGDLWLISDRDYGFKDLDLRLAKQVANQCAIALRQARLYHAAQRQVEELEALNQLKDDFLSTVSHELRTPVSNMKMSIRMLELALSRLTPNVLLEPKPAQYLQILRDECDREIILINDLLDLQRLEAGTYVAEREALCLQNWLPSLVAGFQERAQSRQQTLHVILKPDLPTLSVDAVSLERILTELLNNACKYTPPGETIMVIGSMEFGSVQLQVRNTGIEIEPGELNQIFKKFYRIVGSDRWKQGGTGLGLTLVQKLAAQIGAVLHVESASNQTTFTLDLVDSAIDQKRDLVDNSALSAT
ncbi:MULTISPECIES: ATP-binding protein [Cyanophyceae]|uniref:histidine kinase n=1 Tax=Stenomitos frigidus AS-A4 TaxID=2933935 RepID=A0ABV0KJ58_9CYAN|nr:MULTISPECIES: ATP-binding protein [Cyanophyceae]